MSRLIDADDLIEYIGNSISSDQKEFIDCINRQPTVLDNKEIRVFNTIDIIESLKDKYRSVSNDEDLEWNRAIYCAIKIIRGE